MWKALLKLLPKISSCVNVLETKNGNVNSSFPILKVMSHSPLFSMLEPFAALILMWLLKSSVLNLLGIFLYFFKDMTHFPAPGSQSVL